MNEAHDLVRARAQLLDRAGLDPAALRRGLVNLYEVWLRERAAELGIGAGSGLAIVAVGSLGSGEMAPYSDLDLMVVHADVAPTRLEQIAEGLWYPLWDAHIGLDHSVRTIAETQRAAAGEVTTALGLLQARHITGDTELSARLVECLRRQWRVSIHSRFDELVSHTRARWERSGNIADRVEPDLKNGHGGLRDVDLLDALAVAQVVDRSPGLPAGELESAHCRLLDVRTELHRRAGRRRDHLRAQDADDIGAALGTGDRFALARTVSGAARTVGYGVEAGLRLAANTLSRQRRPTHGRLPARRGLAEGVVEAYGEVTLARGASPETDPGLTLRVAAAAAEQAMPISPGALTRLARDAPALPEPWPFDARNDFVALLGSGRPAVAVIEALDRTGVWGRLVPEWDAVRDLAPRDPIHIWTVDRHLVETAVRAREAATRVTRPDLLALGALLHDIGKGSRGQHSAVGARLAMRVGTRIGLPAADVHMLGAMVTHHLLLPTIATRRDVTDPATIAGVVDAVEGDAALLALLHALTEADAQATGPGVWNEWKAMLVGALVRGSAQVLAGTPTPAPRPLMPEAAVGDRAADDFVVSMVPDSLTNGYLVTVVGPDHPELLAQVSGVMALQSLRVRSAHTDTRHGVAVHSFVVSTTFGAPQEAALLRQELIRVRTGRVDLLDLLARREREGGVGRPTAASRPGVPSTEVVPKPTVTWSSEGMGAGAPVVVEVRAEDRVGLLCRLALALCAAGVAVRWARLATLGVIVVDTFGLDVGAEDQARRAAIERALLAAC